MALDWNKNSIQIKSKRNPNDKVILNATADLIETRNVQYKTIDPVHSPGSLYSFSFASARTFQLSTVKLISRTKAEASENYRNIQLLRAWCMPSFGQSQNLGAPPNIVELTAYSSNSATAEHLRNIPVLIQQLNIPFPSDVDYVPTLEGVPMPIIMTLDLTLIEAHSFVEYENFKLSDYKNGVLPGF